MSGLLHCGLCSCAGVPKEKMGAMLAGVESASTECTWDAANNHLGTEILEDTKLGSDSPRSSSMFGFHQRVKSLSVVFARDGFVFATRSGK